MFIDRVRITVAAGNGGDGAVSFYRGPGLPKGGPDGGDGGDGGDLIFEADEGLNTLAEFRGVKELAAQPGENGRKKQQTGARGADRVIRVPPGTQLYDDNTAELVADIGPGERRVICRGGRGGYGNEHFKSATNQAPRTATPGEPGERRELLLELKLIADVGLVGMPNAGKSTLLRSLTRAKAKVGDYPFTTLSPQLGIAELEGGRRLVLADIPGLIEGAAQGAGLGHEFLRHVERTRVLVHLLDAAPSDRSDPLERYRTIREELDAYAPALAAKHEVVALNKADLFVDEDELRELVAQVRSGVPPEREVIAISGASGRGTRELLELLWTLVREETEEPGPAGGPAQTR